MQLGDWQLDVVSGGTFRLDGGAMFGVVPKPLWEKKEPADPRNRIRMATHCLLARDGDHTVLIDSGFGTKGSERDRELMDLESGDVLVQNLAQLGVGPDEVDFVIFSHLHFDHCGGATRFDSRGQVVPVFTRARHIVQAREWRDAMSGTAELRSSYAPIHLHALDAADRITRVDGEAEVCPGIRTWLTGGHTHGHHMLRVDSRGETALYLGDLCPMEPHLRMLWCMAYDVDVLETRRRKPDVLRQAADGGWLVIFDHDPDLVAGRLQRDEKYEFRLTERFTSF